MHLQKYIAILSFLAVVGISAPVAMSEENLNIAETDDMILPTRVKDQNKRGDETIAWVPPPPTPKIPLTRVIRQNKRGDETIAWVPPPPTPKIPV